MLEGGGGDAANHLPRRLCRYPEAQLYCFTSFLPRAAASSEAAGVEFIAENGGGAGVRL